MRVQHLVSSALVLATIACGGSPSLQSPVGRWALVTLVRGGEDRTNQGVTRAGAVRYYTFNADGTFRIELGDSVTETGTWSVDTSVSPKIFDHIPDVHGRPGPYVPGIYAVDGNILKISILPPNPTNRRPTQFESTAADSSWLLIFKRAAR